MTTRGSLRIYLGYAAGVGKTFAMLGEGVRRRERGTDVVVGFVETHGRPKTRERLGGLEVIPRRSIEYRSSRFEEMDVDAILARAPEIALIDELAHTNVPGSRNEKRWQDVEELLEAGIDVISTVNIQHLESLNDVVERITGAKQRETIPDEVVRAADQVELVDMTPFALRRRMAHGNIYPAEKIDAALANYFREGNLGALREFALLWMADRVDEALQDYMRDHGIEGPWETRERILVGVSGRAEDEPLIRRAARMATRRGGELLAVHVIPEDGPEDVPALDATRKLVEMVGGSFHEVVGRNMPEALLDFARAENVTQVVLGASNRPRSRQLLRPSVINRVIRDSGPIDVHVISMSETPPHAPLRAPTVSGLSARRRAYGSLFALITLPAADRAPDGVPRSRRRVDRAADVPADRGRHGGHRRALARARRGRRQLAADQLLLRAADPHVDDRGTRAPVRDLRVRRGRGRGERAGESSGAPASRGATRAGGGRGSGASGRPAGGRRRPASRSRAARAHHVRLGRRVGLAAD